MGQPNNKIAQATIKDHVAITFSDLANINNPTVGSMAYVKDSSFTYVYRGALPTPETAPYAWEQYVNPTTGGNDDQVASEVPFTPTGNTTSTNLQAAVETALGNTVQAVNLYSVDGSLFWIASDASLWYIDATAQIT